MRRGLWLGLVLGLVSAGASPAWPGPRSDVMATASVTDMPPLPMPDYLQPVTDPVFGTAITRVTDPGQTMAPSVTCRPAFCRHRYSSTQAWNADQSLLVITNGCHGFCFLDGRTYKPLFSRSMGGEDCKWHPTLPALMICVSAGSVYFWAPRVNARTQLYAPGEYSDLKFGPWKGNLSNDGRKLVLVAKDAQGRPVAFAYDAIERRKHPDIPLDSLPGRTRSCDITASGRFVACFQKTEHDIEDAYFFTLDGALVQHWPEHHRPGHGDMALDADGRDVYVGISKADPDKWHVITRRIENGAVTDLAASGYGVHASARNIARPGWVFVSYEGSRDQVAGKMRAPFYQEVVAIRLDGSGGIVRIAHTYNARVDYQSETHASPSPDGSQVIWASNWGVKGGPVAAYVAHVPWPDSSANLAR